ncbi:hypothetical protein, partial [Amycolatopsis sp. SID8362]|uniref:hypothetical protein n=1 Tax=Amycolatopsis sp. SID8362 TaxID=2690346 RepID=UPI001368F028
VLLIPVPDPVGLPVSDGVRLATSTVLSHLRGHLEDDKRLVFVTRGGPAAAAAEGLVRSAQAERPGRFFLLSGVPAAAELAA